MDKPRTETLQWDINVPLLTNRHMLIALTKAMFGATALVVALVALLLGIQGDWEVIPRIAALLLLIGSGLFLFGLVFMAFPFRNRISTRFLIDSDGVHASVTDNAVKLVGRLGFWVGLVLGSATAAGSGILARTQQNQALRWRGSFRAAVEPATCSIALCNGWRTLLRVYCLPDNFDSAVAMIDRHMELHGTTRRADTSSPVRNYVLRTLLMVLVSLPLFFLGDIFDFGLLLPLLVLCFGIAMIWFVRQLAWGVLALLGYVFIRSILGAFAERHSYLGKVPYLRYETLSGDAWALIALATLSVAAIAWLAIATLCERIMPALTQDMIDGGDDQ